LGISTVNFPASELYSYQELVFVAIGLEGLADSLLAIGLEGLAVSLLGVDGVQALTVNKTKPTAKEADLFILKPMFNFSNTDESICWQIAQHRDFSVCTLLRIKKQTL
jgi:hypothetical protein